MSDAPHTVSGEVAAPAQRDATNGKRKRATIILTLLIVSGIFLACHWWLQSKRHITTDNAFIVGDVFEISSRIPATIKQVYVRDNQFVKKGDLLLELDPTDYAVRLRNASSNLDVTRNETSGDYARVESVKAALKLARARLDQANLDLKRGKTLYQREVVPREQLDRLETAVKIASLRVKGGEDDLRMAMAEVGLAGTGVKEAKISQKRALRDEAALNLSYTKIYAPSDGYITRKNAENGNYAQTGQPLMALVRLDEAWIVANYKERQLSHVRQGQKVDFEVDAYPGRKFTGRVDSVMAGTGAAFSLLPPENASGNYVKVVQRIPVKILVDRQSDPDHLLRVGMSVVPTIRTERPLSDILNELNPFS